MSYATRTSMHPCIHASMHAYILLPPQVVLSYPMPMTPTSEFTVSLAGAGYSLCCGALNRFMWDVVEKQSIVNIHAKAARRNVESAAADLKLPVVTVDDMLNCEGLPVL
jgi:hypothetical protein